MIHILSQILRDRINFQLILNMIDIQRNLVYFKTGVRFQFIPSFTTTVISRNELFDMAFFRILTIFWNVH